MVEKNNRSEKKMPNVTCSYCGKEMHLQESRASKTKKHFCNKEHFYLYREKYNYHPKRKPGISTYMRLKKFAELRSRQ